MVEMTATPPRDMRARRLEIAPEELGDPSTHIGRIVNTPKVADLLVAEKVKGAKAPDQLAKVLVEESLQRIAGSATDETADADEGKHCEVAPKAVGILCNTVATAKATAAMLLKQKAIAEEQVELVIGAMRPIDRDRQTEWLRQRISTGSDRSQLDKPLFVVATQCIEVGADYDFDVLVTEAAPLDALTQRFGRLNRAGRPIAAGACVVMRGDLVRSDDQLQADDKVFKYADPIYGNAISYTWNWLRSVAEAGTVDFGIAALKHLVSTISPEKALQLQSSKADAPTLLPAHLDLLCQTSQPPWPDPDVSLWLHGPQRNDPEVQVCWRGDLLPPARRPGGEGEPIEISLAPLTDPQRHEEVIHALTVSPPTSAECLTVPLRRVRSWLQSVAREKRLEADLSGDVAAIVEDAEGTAERIPAAFRPIAWRGSERSEIIADVREIRPGDTLVLTPLAGGWDELGYLPELAGYRLRDENGRHLHTQLQSLSGSSPTVRCDSDDFEKAFAVDIGSQTFVRVHNRPIARLHPNLIAVESGRVILHKALGERNRGELSSDAELLERLSSLLDRFSPGFTKSPSSQTKIEYYPDRAGLVAIGPLQAKATDFALVGDDEADDYSRITPGVPIELSGHLQAVRTETSKVASRLALTALQQTFENAAAMHDWGKADPRFQAVLLGGDVFAAIWEGALYAKSAKLPSSLHEWDTARQLANLPRGFRHEMLSLAFAETHPETASGAEDAELLLHLIASHHGHARPWTPAAPDEMPPETSLELIGLPTLVVTEADRRRLEYHRLDSSVPSRFWRVTRKYGWWGAAFLESVLRLSDQRVSQLESLRQSHSSQPSDRPLSGAV